MGAVGGGPGNRQLEFPFGACLNINMSLWASGMGIRNLLGDRDINEHAFDAMHGTRLHIFSSGSKPQASAEELVRIYTDKMIPFEGDRLMLDYSAENMYSEHIAKLVSWHRYYTRFWKQSAMFCDWRWPDF